MLSLPGDDPMEGEKKNLYYRFNEVSDEQFHPVKKLRVLLGATRCCIVETRFPAR